MRQEDQNQLTETPKHEIPAPIVKTKPDLPSWDKMMAEAEALGGGAASRKRFVGVRQRPSGRWVAEIKDTIQKIRVWLGTYDTAEEAARAYDEAACLLRGATTRTNFWAGSDPGRSRPVLPPKITKLLLQRIRARSMDLETTSHLVDGGSQHCKRNDDVLAKKSTVAKRIKKNGENNVDCREGSSRNDTVVAESLTTKAVTINGSISDDGKNANNNSVIEFGMFDDPNYSASGDLSTTRMPAYYSAFDIAHEMMNPFMKQSEEEGGDCSFHSLGEDQSSIEGLSEISKRLNFERKFSASLYTYNGVTECLNRTMVVDGNSSDGTNSDGCDISDNQCQISSSCSSSSFNGEENGELSLWSSLDLPSLCFFN